MKDQATEQGFTADAPQHPAMSPEQLHALKGWVEKQCTFLIERRLGMPIDWKTICDATDYERQFDEIMLAPSATRGAV